MWIGEILSARSFFRDLQAIKKFANKINRDPGIVLGRLQKDKKIDYNDYTMNTLRRKYKVCTKF